MNEPRTFTGVRRTRRTRFGVKVSDMVARTFITIGGIGTIIAVTTVCAFLVWVVLPLFGSADVEKPVVHEAPTEQPPMRLVVDEYQVLGLAVQPSGEMTHFRLDTGETLGRTNILGGRRITAASFPPAGEGAVFALDDGSIVEGEIGFITEFLDADNVTDEALLSMQRGEVGPFRNGMVQVTPEGQFRLQNVRVVLGDPIKTSLESPIKLVDRAERIAGPIFAVVTDAGGLSIITVRELKNMMTGKVTRRPRVVPVELPDDVANPDFIEFNAIGTNLLLAWRSGRAVRFDIQDLSNVIRMEDLQLVEEGTELTSLHYMLGNSTLIAGNDQGKVTAWFGIKPEDINEASADGVLTIRARDLPDAGGGVTAFDNSTRTRMIAVGDRSGHVELVYVTTGQRVARLDAGVGQPVDALAISPKEDGIIAFAGGKLTWWRVDPKYPEASFRSLFTRVWYESYNTPTHTWQSSSGDDAFEPKLGLVPLIFGTMKATVYSMMFAVPIALLAAIYTSEFLHPRVKARVKPIVELMASLPSVVLGFLAGLVIAPLVQQVVPGSIALLFTIPFMMLVGAYLWQLLPRYVQIRLNNLGMGEAQQREGHVLSPARLVFTFGGVRLLAMLVLLLIGVALAYLIGPMIETILFQGDLIAWLSGSGGKFGAFGGWFVILLPVSLLLGIFVLTRFVHPRFREMSHEWTHRKAAFADLIKFIISVVVVCGISALLASLLAVVGFDPRGSSDVDIAGFDFSIMGTYIQRNALIVGFIMGFAVIPIIYTIAEDALSSVPQHLRSASLGAGATPWQTATRIILPTAASGLFSACMIGLGRAVGETMIVLMAAGNTPLLEANIFNGFRTLSANIAVELPEAPKGGTHFRTLFLAALTLFVMTFIINTLAESVRQHFRKRAYQL